MRVGNNQSIVNLLASHASQRQQRVFQNLGDRAAEFISKRGADTFTRTAQRVNGSEAQSVRSEAPYVPNPSVRTEQAALTPEQTAVAKAKTLESQGGSVSDAFTPIVAQTGADTSEVAAPAYTQGDIDDLLKLWGAVEGDDRYAASKDFNSDGTINADDLNHMLSHLAETEETTEQTYTQDDLDQLLGAFGTADGDEGYSSSMDMNADGKIDTDDLNHMLSHLAEPDEA